MLHTRPLPSTKAIIHAEERHLRGVVQGTGIAHVADGKIWGRDSIMTYSGTCEVDGDRFTAIISIKRHTEGHATVFGADDLTLRLEGKCFDKLAKYVGTAEQVPGVLLEGTLILSEELPARSKGERADTKVRSSQAAKITKALSLIDQDRVPPEASCSDWRNRSICILKLAGNSRSSFN
jgi:hypothetical protein